MNHPFGGILIVSMQLGATLALAVFLGKRQDANHRAWVERGKGQGADFTREKHTR